MDAMDVSRRSAQMQFEARPLTGYMKIVIGRRYTARDANMASATVARECGAAALRAPCGWLSFKLRTAEQS